MPILSHNQITDAIMHIRNKREQLLKEVERTEERTYELDRLEKSVETLAEQLQWVLGFGVKAPQVENVQTKKEKK